MNYKFTFTIAIVLLTVYSAYCDLNIIGKNPCQELKSPVCGSDGYSYSNVSQFCQVNGNKSDEYIISNGTCCSSDRYCNSLTYTTLRRGFNGAKHMATTGAIPARHNAEYTWGLPSNQQPDSRLLYSCPTTDGSTLVTWLENCAGLTTKSGSPLGYIFTKQLCDTVPVFMCYSAAAKDYMVSRVADCERSDYRALLLLGYAIQYYHPRLDA